MFSGAEPAVLSKYIEIAVPDERLLITAMNGPPQTFAEKQWRHEEFDRFERETNQGSWIIRSLIVALLAVIVVIIFDVGNPNPRPWDFAKWFGAAYFCSTFVFVVMLYYYFKAKRVEVAGARRAQLAHWDVK